MSTEKPDMRIFITIYLPWHMCCGITMAHVLWQQNQLYFYTQYQNCSFRSLESDLFVVGPLLSLELLRLYMWTQCGR